MLSEEITVFELPEMIELSSYEDDWRPYLAAVYEQFKKDFLDNTVLCLGKPVRIRTFPKTRDKESGFWHLITEDDQNQRKVEEQRCQRIGWIKSIIEAKGTENVVCWRNNRKGQSNIVIALLDFSYIVVLTDKRDGYCLLLSAYPVRRQKRRENLKKEYEEYLANKNKC